MQESGKVIKIKNSIATVRVNRKSACGSCGMCAIKPKDLYVDLQIENTLNAELFDEVLIDISTGNVAKMSVIAYLIPLAFGILPLLILFKMGLPEYWAIVSFFCGTALGFLFLSLIDKKVFNKPKNMPKMISILTDKEKNLNKEKDI